MITPDFLEATLKAYAGTLKGEREGNNTHLQIGGITLSIYVEPPFTAHIRATGYRAEAIDFDARTLGFGVAGKSIHNFHYQNSMAVANEKLLISVVMALLRREILKEEPYLSDIPQDMRQYADKMLQQLITLQRDSLDNMLIDKPAFRGLFSRLASLVPEILREDYVIDTGMPSASGLASAVVLHKKDDKEHVLFSTRPGYINYASTPNPKVDGSTLHIRLNHKRAEASINIVLSDNRQMFKEWVSRNVKSIPEAQVYASSGAIDANGILRTRLSYDGPFDFAVRALEAMFDAPLGKMLVTRKILSVGNN